MTTGKLQINQIVGNNASFYERCYLNCYPDNEGCISSQTAANLLKKSGLDDILLAKIWNISDEGSKGKLTKNEFCIALKLVSLAQSGFEVKLDNLYLQSQSPRLNTSQTPPLPPPPSQSQTFSNISSPSNHSYPSAIWNISKDDQLKFSKLFDSLHPINKKLSGDAVKPVLINSKLSMEQLGRIWTLSDIDCDGQLDRDEFILTMHLVYQCLSSTTTNNHYTLPSTLPTNLIPPSKRYVNSTLSNNESRPLSRCSNDSLPISSISAASGSWVVGKLEKEQYDNLFVAADKDCDGFINGIEVKEIFLQSGLSQSELAQIWELCDTQKTGKLNRDQFALAMHFVNEQIKCAGTKPIPTILSHEMIPPSMRSAALAAAATNTTTFNNNMIITSDQPVTLSTFGLKAESDDVYSEIDDIKRERGKVEQSCRQMEVDLRNQKNEVEILQSSLERTQQTVETLGTQKQEAQQKLDELNESKTNLEHELSEVRARCQQERQELERLRLDISRENQDAESRKEELRRSQAELAELVRKEGQVREEATQCRLRLTELDRETSNTEQAVESAQLRNEQMERLGNQLREALEKLEAFLANQDDTTTPELPDEIYLDKLLSSDVMKDNVTSSQHSQVTSDWPSTQSIKQHTTFTNDMDPFDKNDPFSTNISDPFNVNLGLDPFNTTLTSSSTLGVPVPPPSSSGAGNTSSANIDPFTNQLANDPFSPLSNNTNKLDATNDPFSVNGWNNNFDDQNSAFSIGDVDEIFKNVNISNESDATTTTTTTKSSSNNTHNTNDPFGFGELTAAKASSSPPPRPSKGPQGPSKHPDHKMTSKNDNWSQQQQVAWAKLESEKEAKQAQLARQQEEADFQLALKLSEAEMKQHHKSKGRRK